MTVFLMSQKNQEYLCLSEILKVITLYISISKNQHPTFKKPSADMQQKTIWKYFLDIALIVYSLSFL